MASVPITLLTFIVIFNIQGVYIDAANFQRKSISSFVSSDENEKIYRFKRALFSDFTVPNAIREDYTIGESVVQIFNNDGNVLQGSQNEQFSIDDQSESKKFTISNEGWLLLAEPLDYESSPTERILVKILQTDGIENFKEVIINIENVPEFDEVKYDGTIEEGKSSNPTNILKVALISSDPDKDDVTFSLNTADALTSNLFDVDNEGNVFARQEIDREVRETFTFEVIATNDAGNSGTTDVVITVTDINDNGPIFSGVVYGLIREEEDAGTLFTLDKAPVDPDQSSDPAKFQYTIEQNANEDSSEFEIAGTSADGKAIIRAKSSLDREITPSLTFTIEVEDQSGIYDVDKGSTLVVVNVEDINDNRPVFDEPLFISDVPEDTPLESSVDEVEATDPDDPSNFALKFEILSGNDDDIFSIETVENTNKGMIILKKILDYDNPQTRKYSLIVRVSDPEDQEDPENPVDPAKQEAQVDIYVTAVNDNTPTFSGIESYNIVISEDIAVNTILKPSVSAEDDDASDEEGGKNKEFSYSIMSETNPGDGFAISSSGELSVKSALDRENVTEYNLTILAIDEGTPPNTGSAQYFINVTDVNDNAPIIPKAQSILWVYEGRAPPEPVNPPLEPYDPDWTVNGPPYIYEWVENPEQFILYHEGNNTEIAYINTTMILDKAQQSVYEMQIKITDSGENPQSQISTLTIEVRSEGASALIGDLSLGGVIAIVITTLILLFIVIAVAAYKCMHNDQVSKAVYVDDDIRENFIAYDEEGGGEEDQEVYDISLISKPVDDTSGVNRSIQPEKSQPLGSGIPMGDAPNIADFIGKGINEADDDPNAPPHDSLHTYEYEGGGSSAGSLSSLNSSSTDEDQNYDYLNDWGPRFQKLADMYGGGESD